MIKKLCLLLATTAMLASAIPAFASGATGLTENGAFIAVGKRLDYTSVGDVTVTTPIGNITCEKGTLTGEVVVNNAALVRVVGVPGMSSLTNCAIGGNPVAVTNFVFTSEETAGGGNGKATLSFSVDLPGITCNYSMAPGAFTYNPAEFAQGGVLNTFNGTPLVVAPAACGPAKFDAVFTRETDGTNIHVFLM